MTNKIYI